MHWSWSESAVFVEFQFAFITVEDDSAPPFRKTTRLVSPGLIRADRIDGFEPDQEFEGHCFVIVGGRSRRVLGSVESAVTRMNEALERAIAETGKRATESRPRGGSR